MTTIKIIVEDENAAILKKLLQEVSFVKSIEEEQTQETGRSAKETSPEKIKTILDQAKGKNLFHDIKDPVEWQREIRKEWDRDF